MPKLQIGFRVYGRVPPAMTFEQDLHVLRAPDAARTGAGATSKHGAVCEQLTPKPQSNYLTGSLF